MLKKKTTTNCKGECEIEKKKKEILKQAQERNKALDTNGVG